MPATTTENLAFPGNNGDNEETKVTNDPANAGFPARVQSGELVFIVRTERDGLKKVLVDGDGNKYLDDGVAGYLKPYSEETLSDDGVADEGPEPTASDEDAAQALAAAEAEAQDPALDESQGIGDPSDLAGIEGYGVNPEGDAAA